MLAQHHGCLKAVAATEREGGSMERVRAGHRGGLLKAMGAGLGKHGRDQVVKVDQVTVLLVELWTPMANQNL
jgi:hypothetical protein